MNKKFVSGDFPAKHIFLNSTIKVFRQQQCIAMQWRQRLTANLEELHEVVKLAVDISADSDGAVDSLASNSNHVNT